jgi:lipid A ethanolaminephosphotransferase
MAIIIVLFYNKNLWGFLNNIADKSPIIQTIVMISFFILLVSIIDFVFTIINIKSLQKPMSVAIVLSASLASYLIETYDKIMLINSLEIGVYDIIDFLNFKSMIYFVSLGTISSLLILYVNISYDSLKEECKNRVITGLICILIIISNLSLFYEDYSSTFRNHREIRNLIIPSRYLYYTARYLTDTHEYSTKELLATAEGAGFSDN